MTRTDKRALRLAVEVARKDRGRAEQLDHMLKTKTWEAVAQFAASCVQSRALRLRPWQLCPCDVDRADLAHAPEHHQAKAAYALQQRMRELGISKFHPDPPTAIAEAERARKTA